ncbi:MAG: transcription antitermination factor NusB [Oligoflexia bacterium]|nr:transcription antitermination factor NusB [Oligoflexia bacterium]
MRHPQNKLHPRRIARIYSFQFLYHLQFREIKEIRDKLLDDNLRGKYILESIENFNETLSSLECELEVDKKETNKDTNTIKIPLGKNMQYALSIVTGVLSKYHELEKIIEAHSKNWSIAKIAKVDLTILLQAVYELIYLKDTPKRVVIDEAIEMAKSFSDEQSWAFVNGILDAIVRTLEKEKTQAQAQIQNQAQDQSDDQNNE